MEDSINSDDSTLNATQARLLLAELAGVEPVTRQRFALMCRTRRINAIRNPLHGSWEVARSEVERFVREDYQPNKRGRDRE